MAVAQRRYVCLGRIDRRDPSRPGPPGELRGQRTGAASDVEDPAVERESGEIGEGHRQRTRVAADEPVIGIGIAQTHFFSFGGSARAKATLCITQGSSARFLETDSASTRSQPFISRPRISHEAVDHSQPPSTELRADPTVGRCSILCWKTRAGNRRNGIESLPEELFVELLCLRARGNAKIGA